MDKLWSYIPLEVGSIPTRPIKGNRNEGTKYRVGES